MGVGLEELRSDPACFPAPNGRDSSSERSREAERRNSCMNSSEQILLSLSNLMTTLAPNEKTAGSRKESGGTLSRVRAGRGPKRLAGGPETVASGSSQKG